MTYEGDRLWRKKKKDNEKKIKGLVKKWRRPRMREPDICGVLYRDDDLDVEADDKLDDEEVTVYGGVEVSNEEKEVLKMKESLSSELVAIRKAIDKPNLECFSADH